jgi:hypothetical protein
MQAQLEKTKIRAERTTRRASKFKKTAIQRKLKQRKARVNVPDII